ncbi:hypothetical protein AXF42_Ash012481 [Apostasia shenzhenica]|uniref:Uncharacterized protein n=1 Tax=Apostasia shenzhenica TaxID=1088818 RepID=A0A2I0AQW7_9ASPA|nr:hypothetical protein AXF42_Ash012481 [Apostasia shenzhenica]
MEAEAERMAALKRAYADIILNTAKESAARVLAAERRALGFQQSLCAAKEEAVATMLRLKSIMEEKIRETEKESVCKEKKIEELELQLGEAEDTIVDLREELKIVREELRKIKDESLQLFGEQKIAKKANFSTLDEAANNGLTPVYNEAAGTNVYCSQKASQTEHVRCFSAEVDCTANADLASIILRRKEPDLYKNGYTQRIHALEHNLLTAKRESHDEVVHIHEESEKPSISCGDNHVKFFGRVSPMKQRAVFRQSNTLSNSIYPDTYTVSELNVVARYNQSGGEEPKEVVTALVPEPTIMAGDAEDWKGGSDTSPERDSLIMQRCSSGKSKERQTTGFNHCSKRITKQSLKKQGQPDCENEMALSSLQSAEEVSKVVVVAASPKALNVDKDEDDSACVVKPLMDVSLLHSFDRNDADGTDKFLKYTFQRKRKRGSSPIKNNIAFPKEKSTVKTKLDVKMNSLQEPPKPNVVTDLPRNNRRLIQVARQLISLSEKRW